MMREHTSIDERLAALALDGLDAEEVSQLRREMDAHGDCDTCRRLEAEHRETAGLLPLALQPRPVDPELVDRIVARPRTVSRRDARLRRWQAAAGVAAAVAAALAIALITRPAPDVVPRQFVSFEGGRGQLAVAYARGERGLVLWGTGIPDPGPGRVYELWLIDDGAPSRGACLAPRDGALGAYLDVDLAEADLLAVTVEAPSCPDAPTTEPVYTASL